MAKFAAHFAQRVGSLVNSMSSRGGLPTDEELEAEAERERERSRREAERILEQERLTVEERVLAMLQTQGSPKSLPNPPSRAQTMPATPESPSSSQKEQSWWSAAKSKLTPTKESLTPAQQIIQETKAREKEMEKEKKKSSKMSRKSTEWPSAPEGKFEDPAFIQLGRAAASGPPPRPISAAPSSPSSRPLGVFSTPPSLAASPLRANDSSTGSPSRAPPPLYAQFNSEGTLDVPGTLLTVVKRFEKLEKWTVGHVRALEERMDDVERWLVEKEKDKEDHGSRRRGGGAGLEDAVNEMREEVAELQGRIGELGREMAKLVTSPANLSSGPNRSSASFGRAPSTSSMAVRSISTHIVTSPASTPPKAVQSTSPPATTPVATSRPPRTRLPYPTGDYATPPDSTILNQGPFSPTSSPPASLTSASKARHMSISGMPPHPNRSDSMSPFGLPRPSSPERSVSPSALPLPNPPGWRESSVSPTPRKRYTVALGTPLMSADRAEHEGPAGYTPSESRELGTAYFSTSPISSTPANDYETAEESDAGSGVNDETIGKAAARMSGLTVPSNSQGTGTSPHTGKPTKRARPQSMYSPQTAQGLAAPSPITPLNVRLRSRSTDRFGLGISDAAGAPVPANSGKFVDPLLVRKQTKEALASSVPPAPKVMPGKPKVPVNQLVAFFDQEKANK